MFLCLQGVQEADGFEFGDVGSLVRAAMDGYLPPPPAPELNAVQETLQIKVHVSFLEINWFWNQYPSMNK